MPTAAAVRAIPHAHAPIADHRIDGLDKAGHKDLGLLGREHAPLKVPALRAQPCKVEATPMSRSTVGETVLRLVEKARVVVERKGRLAHISRESAPLLGNEDKPSIHRREKALNIPVDDDKKVREEVRVVEHQPAADGRPARRYARRPAKVARQPIHNRRIRGHVQTRLQLKQLRGEAYVTLLRDHRRGNLLVEELDRNARPVVGLVARPLSIRCGDAHGGDVEWAT